MLFDDRDIRAGEKFGDADLIGIPLRVIVGDKAIAESKSSGNPLKYEVQDMKSGKENAKTESFDQSELITYIGNRNV